MKIIFLACSLLVLAFALPTFAQVPTSTLVQILKAEDERRYDKTLEDLMKNPNAKIRTRAALAAGRIGNEKAVPVLAMMLEADTIAEVRAMAAFALGEIESMTATDAILKMLSGAPQSETRPVGSVPNVNARLVEAAGKIAAANAKDEKSKLLGEAILDTLEAEDAKAAEQNRETVLLALTAALRSRPEETNIVVAKFLTNLDARIRADAANTLSRIRAKNANAALRTMLISDSDPIARANAARALGAAEDKEAFSALLEAATGDEDSRVRVSAIRSLAPLKDAMAVDKLLDRGEKLLSLAKKSKRPQPAETNELLEIAAVLGRLVQNLNDGRTVRFLTELRRVGKFRYPEAEIAFARVSPERYVDESMPGFVDSWAVSAYAQGIQIIAASDNADLKAKAFAALRKYSPTSYTKNPLPEKIIDDPIMINAMPDIIRAIAAFKPDNLDTTLRELVSNDDVFIRATAVDLLSERPPSKENIDALKTAFAASLRSDAIYNDAQLGILDALNKLDPSESVGIAEAALKSPDYLVRRKMFDLLKAADPAKAPNAFTIIKNASANQKDRVLRHASDANSKLGQILNTEADYKRAASQQNGALKAVFSTGKGTFVMDLLPEDAPLTIDNFINLAKSGYFNGVEVHRVVPNFVMQDGDPRGDGNGGPGWSIRCEVNMVPFDRGVVGMALSGKDTGGSQWFATHSPQPHLDGGYTVFGRVNETGMKVVDNIVRGDKIISVKIIEGNSTRRSPRTRSRKK